MTVQRMFLHPQFNHFTVDNDIALLRLPRPVRLPVACLPTVEPVDRELCFIMGWGKQKSEDIYGTNKLHEALVSIVYAIVSYALQARSRTCSDCAVVHIRLVHE